MRTWSRSFVIGLFGAVLAVPCMAQRVQLVRDINRTLGPNPSSVPQEFTTLGTSVLFSATSPATGRELFVASLASPLPRLLLDIAPAAQSSNPQNLVAANGRVFFSADDGVVGPELWVTDGTTAGTHLVADIRPGAAGSFPRAFTALGSRVLFAAASTAATSELWSTDGTAVGTTLVKSFTSMGSFRRVGSEVFLVADGGGTGGELWKTDGTRAGTVLVRDIRPGPTGSSIWQLADWNGELYFSADDGSTGFELWKSDGTTAGTQLVADLAPGPDNGDPRSLTPFGGRLYFTLSAGTGALWSTDGTAAGTALVGGSFVGPLTVHQGALYFSAVDAAGGELWTSDGTTAGTRRVKDIWPGSGSSFPYDLVSAGDALLFSATDAAFNDELWRSDGTSAGTVQVKDIDPSANGGSSPDLKLVLPNGAGVLFSADDGVHGREPWYTDGMTAGTVLLGDVAAPVNGSSNPMDGADLDGVALFSAAVPDTGAELWRSDGTPGGTFMVWDIMPGAASSSPHELVRAGASVFFEVGMLPQSQLAVPEAELWATDGTSAGTRFLLPASSRCRYLCALGDVVLFSAEDPVHGRELWRSDGTPGGTTLVADLAPGTLGGQPASSSPHDLVRFGDKVFFAAATSMSSLDLQLWYSDGTAAGTGLIRLPGNGSPMPANLTVFGDRLYFSAQDFEGFELWSTDGTQSGTRLVHDINPGPEGSFPMDLTVADGLLYFFATTEPNSSNRYGLYRTDGTPGGLVLLHTPSSLPSTTLPLVLGTIGSIALFRVSDPATGDELWRTDGTSAGTALLADILPGTASSYPLQAGFETLHSSRFVYFTAGDGIHGRELWRSDGTAAGTALVLDLRAGPAVSAPSAVALSSGRVLFSADDGVVGRELFALDPGASVQTIGAGCSTGLVVPSLSSTDPVLGAVLTLRGSNAQGTAAWVFAGPRTPGAPLPGGCRFYPAAPSAFLLGAVPIVSGAWTVGGFLPNAPGLLGIGVAAQGFVGPTSGPNGGDLTDAVLLTLGR